MQSKPVLDKSPEVVFLGFNAHEDYGFCGIDRSRFYNGNPMFYQMLEGRMWRIWSKPYFAFKWAGCLRPFEPGNYVFMNAVYFGSRNMAQFNCRPGSQKAMEQCLEYTGELIHQVFQPKYVICFSIASCFIPLHRLFGFRDIKQAAPAIIDGSPSKHSVCKGDWNGIPTFGIPHPSSRSVSNDDWGGIALWMKSEISSIIQEQADLNLDHLE